MTWIVDPQIADEASVEPAACWILPICPCFGATCLLYLCTCKGAGSQYEGSV